MTSVSVEIKTQCKSCGNPLLLNAFVEKIYCPSCQRKSVFPYNLWKKSILKNVMAELGSMKENMQHPVTVFTGEYQFNVTISKTNARCDKCNGILDESKFEESSKSGSISCGKCGYSVSVRTLPDGAKAYFADVKYLISEDTSLFLTEGQVIRMPNDVKPILLSCPSCAGNLNVDGTSRIFTCSY